MKVKQEHIWCPNCHKLCEAVIQLTIPFATYIHDCEHCGRTIMESDWDPVGEMGHELYSDSDIDKPKCILDRNGEVVLGMCKKCRAGEADLYYPCKAK